MIEEQVTFSDSSNEPSLTNSQTDLQTDVKTSALTWPLSNGSPDSADVRRQGETQIVDETPELDSLPEAAPNTRNPDSLSDKAPQPVESNGVTNETTNFNALHIEPDIRISNVVVKRSDEISEVSLSPQETESYSNSGNCSSSSSSYIQNITQPQTNTFGSTNRESKTKFSQNYLGDRGLNVSEVVKEILQGQYHNEF